MPSFAFRAPALLRLLPLTAFLALPLGFPGGLLSLGFLLPPGRRVLDLLVVLGGTLLAQCLLAVPGLLLFVTLLGLGAGPLLFHCLLAFGSLLARPLLCIKLALAGGLGVLGAVLSLVGPGLVRLHVAPAGLCGIFR